MSKDLGPTELRVCRLVFALLAVTTVAFLLFHAIAYLFHPSSPVRNVQKHADITNSTGPDQKQPTQSSPPMQTMGGPARGAGLDDPAPVSLPNVKVRSELFQAAALERIIRFDPRPLERSLNGTSLIPADAAPKPTGTQTFQALQEGTMVAPNFASADPNSLDTPQPIKPSPQQSSPPTLDEPKEPTPGSAPFYENVRQIQSRLRDLGFLSSTPSSAWDGRTRNALRDFKLVNRLANNDIWDLQTSEKLNSQTAIRADQSFIGNWSTAPCQSVRTKTAQLSISSRRARSSEGSVCEFHDFASDNQGWRVRATCSLGDQRWTANGKFTLTADKLVWTSDRDVISYFRCN
jgi:hypothetical protein